MHFTINQAELMSALNAGKASCKKRSQLEAINNVLIQAGSGEVRFTTTDLTMRITYTATETGQVSEEGVYTVNYKQLVDTVKVLPKQADITLPVITIRITRREPGDTMFIESQKKSREPFSSPVPIVLCTHIGVSTRRRSHRRLS